MRQHRRVQLSFSFSLVVRPHGPPPTSETRGQRPLIVWATAERVASAARSLQCSRLVSHVVCVASLLCWLAHVVQHHLASTTLKAAYLGVHVVSNIHLRFLGVLWQVVEVPQAVHVLLGGYLVENGSCATLRIVTCFGVEVYLDSKLSVFQVGD